MGFAGVGVVQLLIVLGIVIMIFGTKRISQLGGDIGGMITGIRGGLKDAEPVVEELKDLHNEVQEFSTQIKGTDNVRTSKADHVG